MNTELQNKTWSVLPKEFKEEVKKMYCTPKLHSEQYTLLQRLFGGNLTSCTESKEETDKHFDNILKDSFRNERRLNVAVQILSGIIASSKPCKHPVKRAIELTDALIDECEKRSSDGKD